MPYYNRDPQRYHHFHNRPHRFNRFTPRCGEISAFGKHLAASPRSTPLIDGAIGLYRDNGNMKLLEALDGFYRGSIEVIYA